MQAEAATSAVTGTKSQIFAALHQAARATGADFQYLLDTATRESGLKTQAKSGTSSASGLFQFVDQTWMGLVKKYGAQYGLGAYSAAISKGADGRFKADNPAEQKAIIALKNDPRTSALMAGHYASDSRDRLEDRLGRDVGNGELYAAHFLGAGSASRLIQLNGSNPNASAAAAFPQAANANRSVFYHTDGSAKSVREVYAWATKQNTGSSSAPQIRTANLHLRRSVSDGDTLPPDMLPMMLLSGRNDDLAGLGSFGVPSLTSSMLDVLASMRSEDENRTRS